MYLLSTSMNIGMTIAIAKNLTTQQPYQYFGGKVVADDYDLAYLDSMNCLPGGEEIQRDGDITNSSQSVASSELVINSTTSSNSTQYTDHDLKSL